MIIGRAANKNLPVLFAGLVILDFAGKVDLRQSQVGVQTQHGDSEGILGLPGSSKHPQSPLST